MYTHELQNKIHETIIIYIFFTRCLYVHATLKQIITSCQTRRETQRHGRQSDMRKRNKCAISLIFSFSRSLILSMQFRNYPSTLVAFYRSLDVKQG